MSSGAAAGRSAEVELYRDDYRMERIFRPAPELVDASAPAIGIEAAGTVVVLPIRRWLALADLLALLDEIDRQDAKHGPFSGSRLGRQRLSLACVEDELREALSAWQMEKRTATLPDGVEGGFIPSPGHSAAEELLQTAAVAMRAIRDAFTPPGDGPVRYAGPIGGLPRSREHVGIVRDGASNRDLGGLS